MQALQYLCDQEGSDLHIKAGSPPMIRISGELTPLPMADPLTPDDTAQALREMLRDPTRLQEMETEGEADFALRRAGPGSLPCQRLPPAWLDLDRLPAHPVRRHHDRRARAARRGPRDGRGAARDRARHRHHRLR